MNIGILEPENFSPEAETVLRRLGTLTHDRGGDLDAFLAPLDALFVRLHHFIDAAFLARAPRLRYLCSPTTGLNHVDLDAIRHRNIDIVCLRGELDFLATVRATPENGFGLTLALLRNYKDAFRSPDAPHWQRDPYRGHELCGATVGIVGMGRVGCILARYFHAFDAAVAYYDIAETLPPPPFARRFEDLEAMLDHCTIAIMAASYAPENARFFEARHLDRLRDKFFVNIARGELINEDHLIARIRDHHFRGVALDVIANENGPSNLHRFLELVPGRNLILTPHISGATYESMVKTEIFIAEKLAHRIASGQAASPTP